MPCSNQFINFVPGCAKSIIINANIHQGHGHNEDSIYKAKLTYPNGFVLTIAALEPDEDGSIAIANNGYWHNGTGDVMLQLFKDNDCLPFEFNHCGRKYESVLLSFINEFTTPEEEEHTIFCDCPETNDEEE